MSDTEKEMLKELELYSVAACQSFEPYYQKDFTCKGEKFEARPDGIYALLDEAKEPLFLELKSCLLNTKTSPRTARNALLRQYNYRFYPVTGDHLNHSQLSSALDKVKRKDCLDHAWNHSQHKHATVSRALPIGKYIVVFTDAVFFKDNLETSKALAEYERLGIQCMALSQVPDYLRSL